MKKFNPLEWLNNTEPTETTETTETNIKKENTNSHKQTNTNNYEIKNTNQEIEEIVKRIELQTIDITSTYNNWRDIGFALVSELGEAGRSYFHRISRFHSDYNVESCDKQYNNCLNSKGSGIAIKTFFHLAKEHNINISIPKNRPNRESTTTTSIVSKYPNFPKSIYTQLPEFLNNICSLADSQHDKDILLLGSIATLSGTLPKIYGIYDRKVVFPNLFLFLTAKASAGKGMLNHCRHLAKPIHDDLRKDNKSLQQQYQRDLNVYNAEKRKNPDAKKPTPPPVKLLFIPANSSATGVFQLLSDNNGKGIMFETEGDTLSNTFKSDYGNYSDGFRKAFHHESISYYRRTDREHAEIDLPRLSAILTGTPNQITNLIPDAENGLFSRFMFYYVDIKNTWKNVFDKKAENGLDEVFENLGREFLNFYKVLKTNLKIKFSLTKEQETEFNVIFAALQDKYFKLLGDEYIATVRRLGLITYRIAMILTTLRIMETGEISSPLLCNDADFNTAIQVTQTLVLHAQQIFTDLPGKAELPKQFNKKQKFYNNLPATFNRPSYIAIAEKLSIPTKTAEGYITSFIKDRLLHREKNSEYIKLLSQENKE